MAIKIAAKRWPLLTVVVLMAPASSLGAGEDSKSAEEGMVPRLVSPGGNGREGRVATGCPGFSWAEVEGAQSYEVVVYEVGEIGDSRMPGEEPVLRQEIPAGATWWTPELEDCLASGRYGWVVGAVTVDGRKRWSRPSLFRVEEAARAAAGPRQRQRDQVADRPARVELPSSSGPPAASSLQPLPAEVYAPAPCASGGELFLDVPASDPFCRWIELVARGGIAPGCGDGSIFCPDNPVTRKQLARVLGRVMYGGDQWSPAQGVNPLSPPAANTITTVDDPSNPIGFFTSITIGADGLPIISYMNLGDGGDIHLKVAHCNDVACAGGDETVTTVDDSVNHVGYFNSITIGADGLPIISYVDDTADTLKVAHCNDVACAGMDEAITTVAGPLSNASPYTSIAIGADGLPIISYLDAAGNLSVAHCNDVACVGMGEAINVVDDDPLNNVGSYGSIAIGTDGLPIISYRAEGAGGGLKVAHCNDRECAGMNETLTVVDAGGLFGLYTSITIGADGFPIISHFDEAADSLRVVHCNDVACSGTGETKTVVDDPLNEVGMENSITIGADGLPIISYRDFSAGALKVAHCNDPACDGMNETITTVEDTAAIVGSGTSITIGVDGLPIISYNDFSAQTLKVAHCANVFCTPYFRRR